MQIDGWKYYNHAAIPTTAPHQNPDMRPVEDGSIWKIKGGIPLLARWTTEFDCGYETNWWYVIKDSPFEFETLDSKARKHIRQSLKKVLVEKIHIDEYADQLCVVHNNACKSYTNYIGGLVTKAYFLNYDKSAECWAAFSKETGVMIGYMTCKRKQGYVETITAKYDPGYLNLRASDAIHFTILDHYLNNLGFNYLCSGSRTINHTTNAQDYKISTFGFRKAYCQLHVEYNPKFKIIIKLLYFARKLFVKLDSIKLFHQLNGVLLMEDIMRKSK